jgi:hypothetical protein
MPVPPSTWAGSAPITAKQLNTDLYTFTPGNNHTPNGILFHSNRPSYITNLFSAGSGAPSSTGGVTQGMVSENFNFWTSYLDNSALFGIGCDFPAQSSLGMFLAMVSGAGGTPITTFGTAGFTANNGWYLVTGVIPTKATSNVGAIGASYYAQQSSGAFSVVGGAKQAVDTAVNNSSYVLDIAPAVGSTAITAANLGMQIAVFAASTTGSPVIPFAYAGTAQDYSGEGTRMYVSWVSVNVNGSTVSSLPVPHSGYSSASTITSSFLNGTTGIQGVLNFLNYPPALRQAAAGTTSVPNTTVTQIPLNFNTTVGFNLDSYNGFNSTTSTYTVPVSGVYLCHGLIAWAASSTNSQRLTGIRVNSTNFFGPAYQQATNSTTNSSFTQILDLEAGDTVELVGYQNQGATVQVASILDWNRLVMVWLTSLGGGGSPLTWTPPNTSFRWQAGTSGSALPALFNSHLTNDLSFLMQRPYLLSSQTTAQTGLTAGSFSNITMGSVGGIIHGSPGDNYGGWNAGSNCYVAPVSGWYLATCGYVFANPTATPASFIAGLAQNPPGTAPVDYYQHIASRSNTLNPGAEGVGIYYLRAGDTLQPMAQQQTGTTWATGTNMVGQGSHFELCWLSE